MQEMLCGNSHKKLAIFQVSKWEFLNKISGQKKKERIRIFPCLTISRETGSGGKLVAKKLAARLKLRYYDKALVTLIAKRLKKPKNIIRNFDEKESDTFKEIFGSLFISNTISGPIYFRKLIVTIFSIIRKKPCLILGRGANFIVPSKSSLKVRIVAPLKTRLKNSMKFEKYSERKARSEIRRIHNNRKNFIKRFFFKDISNSNYYDLVLNTKNLSLDQAVDIIEKSFRKKFAKFGFDKKR